MLSTLGTGYYWPWVQGLIPSKKNQSVLIAKLSSRKTQKIPNPQKYKLPHKFHATGQVKLFCARENGGTFHTF